VKVLITGGCGFLGSNLASHAISRGDDLMVFDNLSRKGAAANLEWLSRKGVFKFCHGDVRNESDMNAVVSEFRPEGIFHVAGQVAMTTSIARPRLDFEVNALGTLNLLEAVRRCAPECPVIYSSTNKVYGDLSNISFTEKERRYVCPSHSQGFDESLPLDFHSPYGCSKGCADQYVLDYTRVFALRTVVLRHSSIYGDRQFSTYDQGWIGWFCQQAARLRKSPETEPFTISGDGKQVRDVLYAEDAVACYYAALERIDRAQGEAFNIGGGPANSLSLLELFNLLGELAGVRLQYTRLPWRFSDQKVFVADIRKAARVLGWTPRVNCRDGVGRALAWVSEGTAG
jgi:CDP-paratose 2-epimerase